MAHLAVFFWVNGQDMNLLNEVDQLLTISGAAWAAAIYLYASKETFSDEALLGRSTFNNLQALDLEAFRKFSKKTIFLKEKTHPREI